MNPVYAPNFITGLKLRPDPDHPDHIIRMGAGYCKDDANTYPMVHPKENPIDITVSGAGGLDTGTEEANTWYYVFLIYSPEQNEPHGLLSKSPTDPVMPEHYTLKRRIGSIRNDSDSNFLSFRQQGNQSTRFYQYWIKFRATRVLNNGSSTSWTDVNCSEFIPETSTHAKIWTRQEGTPEARIRPNGFTDLVGMTSILSGQLLFFDITLDNRSIEYRNMATGGSVNIVINGYVEEI